MACSLPYFLAYLRQRLPPDADLVIGEALWMISRPIAGLLFSTPAWSALRTSERGPLVGLNGPPQNIRPNFMPQLREPPTSRPLGFLTSVRESAACPPLVPQQMQHACGPEYSARDVGPVENGWWRPMSISIVHVQRNAFVGEITTFPIRISIEDGLIAAVLRRPCHSAMHTRRLHAAAVPHNRLQQRLSFHADRPQRGKLIVGVRMPDIDYDNPNQVQLAATSRAINLLEVLHASTWSSTADFVTSEVRTVSPADAQPPFTWGAGMYHFSNDTSARPWHSNPDAAKPLFSAGVRYGWLVRNLKTSLFRVCPTPHDQMHGPAPASFRVPWTHAYILLSRMLAFFGFSQEEAHSITDRCQGISADDSYQSHRPDAYVSIGQSESLLNAYAGGISDPHSAAPLCWSTKWAHLRSVAMKAYDAYHVIPESVVFSHRRAIVQDAPHTHVTPAAQLKRQAQDVSIALITNVGDPFGGDKLQAHQANMRNLHLQMAMFATNPGKHLLQSAREQHADTHVPTQVHHTERQPRFVSVPYTHWLLPKAIKLMASCDIAVVWSATPVVPQLLVTLPPWGGVLDLIDSSGTNNGTRSLAGLLGLAYTSFDSHSMVRMSEYYVGLLKTGDTFQYHLPAQHFGVVLADLQEEVARRRLEWLRQADMVAAQGGTAHLYAATGV